MSNLITPMLTSVDNSPVDFYPSIHCTIINNSNEHSLCLSDTSDWNDLEQLVSQSSSFVTSTPIKSRASCYSKNVFTNNSSFTNQNALNFEDSNKNERPVKSFMESHDSNTWNKTKNDSGSCSKACVNVNMGYNAGSSLESMINTKKSQEVSQNVTNIDITTPKLASMRPSVDANLNHKFNSSVIVPLSNDIHQIKTFKNGAKAGHSRQWGSCGSAATLRLNLDVNPISNVTDFSGFKSRTSSNAYGDTLMTTTTNDSRTRSYFKNNNTLKRISQVSFEAEFDAEGRIHEQVSLNLKKVDPYVLAGQITFIELSLFKTIKSEEFLSFKWNAQSKNVYAPNIVASTKWFNQLTFWVQRMILECTELNKRANMMAYFIRVIKKLVDVFNNLSSAKSVIAALQVECIHRLKQTWSSISSRDKATFKRMEDLFSSDNNYSNLRSHVTFMKLPCIPYIGLFLSDLIYINTAHAKLSEFESQTKTDQINNILRTFSEFQQSKYDIVENKSIQRYLESQRYIEELQKIIEDSNFRTSLTLEPPNSDSNGNITAGAIVNNNTGPNLANRLSAAGASNAVGNIHASLGASGASGSLSPQKTITTPPSFTCQHNTLQLPINPLPLSITNVAHNETNGIDIKLGGSTASLNNTKINSDISGDLDDSDLDAVSGGNDEKVGGRDDLQVGITNDDNLENTLTETSNTNHNELIVSQNPKLDKSSSSDSIHTSLFCGASRRARKQNKSSRFFHRHKSVSSTKQPSDVEKNIGGKYNLEETSRLAATPDNLTTNMPVGASASTVASSSTSHHYHHHLKSDSSRKHNASQDSSVILNSTMHSMSLLDDSFLDSSIIPDNMEHTHNTSLNKLTNSSFNPSDTQGAFERNDSTNSGRGSSNIANKTQKLFCTPPIMKCKIRKDEFDLKPKASSKRQTEFSNLVNVVNAARTAAKLSKEACKTKSSRKPTKKVDDDDDEDDDDDDYYEDDVTAIADDSKETTTPQSATTSNIGESLQLICQGVLSRKTCTKTGGRRAIFSTWKRYWIMLLVSSNNNQYSSGFLVYFDSASGAPRRPIERAHFKCEKCYVQDLREVVINYETKSSGRNDSFSLTDVEYGNMYKFRAINPHSEDNMVVTETEPATDDSSTLKQQHFRKSFSLRRLRSGSTGSSLKKRISSKLQIEKTSFSATASDQQPLGSNARNSGDNQADNCILQPSLPLWYHILEDTIACINNVRRGKDDTNKDLIVLVDS